MKNFILFLVFIPLLLFSSILNLFLIECSKFAFYKFRLFFSASLAVQRTKATFKVKCESLHWEDKFWEYLITRQTGDQLAKCCAHVVSNLNLNTSSPISNRGGGPLPISSGCLGFGRYFVEIHQTLQFGSKTQNLESHFLPACFLTTWEGGVGSVLACIS